MIENKTSKRARVSVGVQAAIVILTVVLVAAPAWAQSVPSGRYHLAYKFTPGQELQYLLTQNTSISMSMSAQDMGGPLHTRTETRTKMWLLSEVLHVAEDGSAEVRQKLANLRMDIPFGPSKVVITANERGVTTTVDGRIVVDDMSGVGSISGSIPDAMHEQLFVQGVRVKLMPTGEATVLSDMEQTWDNAGLAMFSSVGSADLVFPDRPLTVGDSWTNSESVPLPQGELNIEASNTLEAVESVSGVRLARIAQKLDMSEAAEAVSGASFPGTMTATAKYWFAIDKGYMEKTEYDIVLRVEPPGEGGSMRIRVRGKIERSKL